MKKIVRTANNLRYSLKPRIIYTAKILLINYFLTIETLAFVLAIGLHSCKYVCKYLKVNT
jgi:DNA polymerase sigma